MTTNDSLNQKEQEQMSAAWARLEKQLQAVEASPIWKQWEENGESKEAAAAAPAAEAEQLRQHDNIVPIQGLRTAVEAEYTSPKHGAARRWIRRNAGKTAAACAAVLIAVVIATPSTNQVLASWLNTFRMDNVMVVQENDLESLMQSFLHEGETLEMSNRFGDFEQTSEGNWEQLSPEQAKQRIGFDIPSIHVAESTTVDISSMSAQSFTFRLNVDEVNGAMRKLGAEKLLPASVDGKAITFSTGNGVQVNYHPSEGSSPKQSLWVTYVEAPTIQVDPSVDVKDAFEAVVRFPALPDHLRKSLLQASSLEEGEIPLPLITNGEPEKVVIEGTMVYVEQDEQSKYSTAMWLQNGYVVSASFHGYDAQKVQSLIAEMIHS
ncbi:hypothetical protein [Paenibacillus prosopidis]|uniref:DUF4367 domain-containing protein n=1 Tax=Paenibacillus prosopidis TaxID=630520 RepID=A0A368VQJ7_9BACL|nr:hypothetical protein [Paenibacillus prosopidis]RCW44180.1 hypothetical protein DFP97_11243 [Paenibacillus prosopidis]